MKQTGLLLGITLAVGIAVGVIGDQVLHAQQPPVKGTDLLRKDLAGCEGWEGIMYLAEQAPGVAGGKHYHPGDVFVYVLEGDGTDYEEGKPPVARKPGDSFYKPARQTSTYIHEIKNDRETAPIKFLVFSVNPKGQPLSIPVK